MVDLFASLPARYANCGQITLLLQVLQQELQRLEDAIRLSRSRGLLQQCDAVGLARWEADLGLPPRPDLPLHSRRALALAALDRSYDGTLGGLDRYIRALAAPEALQLEPDYAGFSLGIQPEGVLQVDRYTLQHRLSHRLPAHISCRFLSDTEENS